MEDSVSSLGKEVSEHKLFCRESHVGLEEIISRDKDLRLEMTENKNEILLRIQELTGRMKLISWFLAIILVAIFGAFFEWTFDIYNPSKNGAVITSHSSELPQNKPNGVRRNGDRME